MIHGLAKIWVNIDEPCGFSLIEGEREAELSDLVVAGLLEMHVFTGPGGSAQSFAAGIAHVGGQAVATHVFSDICLVRQFDKAASTAASVEEAVPLVCHGNSYETSIQGARENLERRVSHFFERRAKEQRAATLHDELTTAWGPLFEASPRTKDVVNRDLQFGNPDRLNSLKERMVISIGQDGPGNSYADITFEKTGSSLTAVFEQKYGLRYGDRYAIERDLPQESAMLLKKHCYDDYFATTACENNPEAIRQALARMEAFAQEAVTLKERHEKFGYLKSFLLEHPIIVKRLDREQRFTRKRRGPVRLGTDTDGCGVTQEIFGKFLRLGLVEESEQRDIYVLSEIGKLAIGGDCEAAASLIKQRNDEYEARRRKRA